MPEDLTLIMFVEIIRGLFFHSTADLSDHNDSFGRRILTRKGYTNVKTRKATDRKYELSLCRVVYPLKTNHLEKDFEAIDKVCAVEGISSDADAKRLTQTNFRRLMHRLVSQRTRSGA